MFVQLANKKIIDPEKIVKILKVGQDYLIYLRQMPPYELLTSEYKWFLYTYKSLVEVEKDVAINVKNIVSYNLDSVLLEDSSEIQLTPEKVKLLQFKCLQLDCGAPNHESHNLVTNLAKQILDMQNLKQMNNKIDENSYNKL